MPRTPTYAALMISLLFLGACQSQQNLLEPETSTRRATASLPAPTEHVLPNTAEESNKEARRAWMAAIHKAAPGVDWREIERQNGLTEQLRRSQAIVTANATATASTSASNWTEIGSRNLAGRMHCAVFSTDGTKLYAGSSLGGVWRGNLNGTDWEPLSNNLYGGAHELAVVPGATANDPDVIVTATNGGSVHVSFDDGASWQPSAGASISSLRGLAVLDDANHTILIYGRGSGIYGGTTVLLASTDSGQSFQLRWQTSGTWLGWMWVPRTGAGASTDVYVIRSGVVHRSTNGGQSFNAVGTVSTNSNRGVLAGSEAGSPTLYAAVRLNGSNDWQLHRSDDAGVNWDLVHTYSDFWESLCASPINPNRVVRAGVECFVSEDGGVNFNKINNWWDYYSNPSVFLHADLPGVHCWLNPAQPSQELWYLSTDGGLYVSADELATVQNLSLEGLGVSQYYSTLSSSNNWDLIAAGAQDQGYQRGSRTPPQGPGPSTDFDQLISGDYGHLTSSDGTHGIVYSTYPGFILVHIGENNPLLYQVDFPNGSDQAWLPPVVADPLDTTKFFFCADSLYRYDRISFSMWSETLHSSHVFTNGGADYISALAFAPSDPQRAYAVNNDGDLFYSSDHGVTWSNSSSPGPNAHYFYGNTLAVHPTDPDEIFVGGSGYSGAGVRRSTNGGVSWQPEVTGLPSTMVYGLAFTTNGSGDVYAATEAGAYRWDSDTEEWTNIMGIEAPITTYWSVESVDDGDTMRFGTYGRGIWDFSVPLELPNLVRGDCNDNGTYDISDPIVGLSYLFPSGAPVDVDCEDACDCNDDGTIDIGDMICMLGGLFGSATVPPVAPHPACGVDPTVDNLNCDLFNACP